MLEKSASLEKRWVFAADVPTYDFLKDRDVRNESDREWLINDLIDDLERDHFLQWEAVACQELGLPLTDRQRRAIGKLLNFGDETDDDRIFYINGIPRPNLLWYDIVRMVVPQLLVPQFQTFDLHYSVTTDGWGELVAALEQHGEGLSLPEGVEHPVEVVPAELRHKLWLQTCVGWLGGLGQEQDLTLLDPEQHFRIEEFISCLREHRESIEFLELTLEKLRTVLVLPPQDEPIFLEMLQKELGLSSATDRIADRL